MMMDFILTNIDNFIVVSYLILTLIIGFFSGKQIRDLKQFAVYERNYPTIILVSTIFATMIGGSSTVGDVGQVYDDGIIFILLPIGYGFGAFFVSEFLSGKMKSNYADAISIGEIIKMHYGNFGQIVTGICSVCFSIISVAAQVFAIGYLFHYFFNIEVITGSIIGYSIIIAYSSFGGINGVVRTDVFQFFILIIAIPLVASEALNSTGGYSGLLAALPEEKFYITKSPLFVKYVLLFFVFSLLYINPPVLQRVLIAPTAKRSSQSFRISAVLAILFAFFITLIGLQGYVLDNGLTQNLVLFHMVKTIMPVGLKGLTIAGLIAAIMSTADSSLNTASIGVVNDVFKPLLKSKITPRFEVTIIRITTVAIGFLTLFVVLQFEKVLDIVVFSIYFWAPIMAVPLYGCIWGFILPIKHFMILIACSIIGVISWIFYFDKIFEFDGIVPLVLINAIIFIILYKIDGHRYFGNKAAKAAKNKG